VPFYTLGAAKINDITLREPGERQKAKIDVASTGLDGACFGIRIDKCRSSPSFNCRRGRQKQVKYEKYG
jgi:hypothetical protein